MASGPRALEARRPRLGLCPALSSRENYVPFRCLPGIKFFEVSAKNGSGVEEAFHTIVRYVHSCQEVLRAVRPAAEELLRAALSRRLCTADAQGLRNALETARECGVAQATVAVAEKKLAKALAKEARAKEKVEAKVRAKEKAEAEATKAEVRAKAAEASKVFWQQRRLTRQQRRQVAAVWLQTAERGRQARRQAAERRRRRRFEAVGAYWPRTENLHHVLLRDAVKRHAGYGSRFLRSEDERRGDARRAAAVVSTFNNILTHGLQAVWLK